jgi:hypothetical protein
VPTSFGAGTNQDVVVVVRAEDLLLFESVPQLAVMPETNADTLEVRFRLWTYAAFASARYPSSIGVLAGTGLVPPTFP